MNDPRDFAYSLVEEGLVSPDYMLTACLKYMSWDDVRDMLRINDLPTGEEDEEEE